MFKNRSKALFIGTLFASLYVIVLIIHFGGSMFSSDSAEVIGGSIATAMVTPHMLMIGIGVVCSWIGFFTRKPVAALVGTILYCAGALLFVLYAIYCVVPIILGFIGYSKQKKLILQ